MKKLLILTTFALYLFSCETNVPSSQTTTSINGVEFIKYNIEGCEYLGRAIGYQSGVFTHSGTCPNPIHKCKCREEK